MKMPKGGAVPRIKFVSPRDRVRAPPLLKDQTEFHQAGMALERWGVDLFGFERRELFDPETGKKVAKPKNGADALKFETRTWREFHKSRDRADMKFWKDLYVRTFEVLRDSALRSVGMVDRSHRKAIEDELNRAMERLTAAKGKDAIHEQVIASLFRLVFLLLGRGPYAVSGKRRDFSTFRTLTYSQTEEQLSWLLQGYIQSQAQAHGFDDHLAADFAFDAWAREKKRQAADRSTYVEWVRESFPETYAIFR